MVKLVKTHYLLILFMCSYVVFSCLTYKNYGITADEEYRYKRGAELLQHYLTSKPLQTTIMPTIEPDLFSFYTLTLNVLNPFGYYEIFHLLSMLFAGSILVVIYCLVYTYTKNPIYSVLGPVFTILTPNFSGHFPGNPIDVPFACALVSGVFITYYFRKSSFSFKKILLLGVVYWLTQCLRPLGFQIYLIYILMAFVYKEKTQSWKSFISTELKTIVLIFIIANFLMVITWPYIAINYFKNLPGILVENAGYSKWDNLILFMGRYIQHTERPWYYLFIYIIFTLPVYILGLVGFSLFHLKNKLKLVIISVLGLNFGLYLVLQPVIYNGMRHFLFMVPFIVLLACFGLWDFLRLSIKIKLKMVVIAVLIVSMSFVFFTILRMYPYQYAYFNELAGGFKGAYTNYETEYWGAMYKESAIYVRDNLTTDNPYDTNVYSCNVSYAVDYYSHKKFIAVVDRQKADYIICDYPEDLRRNLQGEIVHQGYLDGVPFMIIRKNIKINLVV